MELQLFTAPLINCAVTGDWMTQTGDWKMQIIYLIAVVLLWLGMMWLYFYFRKKFASSKYAVEFVFIAGIFLIGGIARLLQNTLVLTSIYQIIGSSLAFEGLDEALSDINIAISLWAGLTFFSIVMAKANYELFSYISLMFKKERNKSIYIFTALTEDSLCLAKDIKKHYEFKKADKKNKKQYRKANIGKCVIVFAGDDLLPFDRKNPLCREVMANGFYYWSYSARGSKKRSILRHLHIYNNNTACCGNLKLKKYLAKLDKLKKETPNKKFQIALTQGLINAITKLTKRTINDRQIAIFSYAAEGLYPKEEQNSENVFEDIEAVASEIKNGKWRKGRMGLILKELPIIEYHLLTRRTINYEVYQKWLDRAIGNFNNDILKRRMQLCVENEANFAAKDLIKKLKKKCGDDFSDILYPASDCQKHFQLLLMGFGGTGQSALQAIYHITSNVYENCSNQPLDISNRYLAASFAATVCDSEIENNSGLFDADHPYFICVNDTCSDSDIQNKRTSLAQNIFDNYLKSGQVPRADVADGVAIGLIKNRLQFPVIKFHKQSCTGKDFFDMIDNDTGTDAKREYNMFVVALGTDNRNITVANTLIADIKKEYRENKGGMCHSKPQIIAVNIRDCRNNPLLDWTEKDEAEFSSLIVIRFGNSCDIYSYQALLDNDTAMAYNQGYNWLYDFVNENNNKKISYSLTDNFDYCYDILKNVKGNVNITTLDSFVRYMVGEMKRINATAQSSAKEEWLKIQLFLKESNFYAEQFGQIILQKYIMAHSGDAKANEKLIKDLCRLEHHRWCRFHIAAGWKFSHMADINPGCKKANKELKLHNNLIPFEMLKVNQLLDIINIAKSIESEINNPNRNSS